MENVWFVLLFGGGHVGSLHASEETTKLEGVLFQEFDVVTDFYDEQPAGFDLLANKVGPSDRKWPIPPNGTSLLEAEGLVLFELECFYQLMYTATAT